MIDFTAKVFLFPALLFLAVNLLPGLIFAGIQQIIIIGVILSILATLLDEWLLNKLKSPLSAFLDWGLTILVIGSASLILPDVQIKLISLVIFATLIAIVEYLTHNLLLKNHHLN